MRDLKKRKTQKLLSVLDPKMFEKAAEMIANRGDTLACMALFSATKFDFQKYRQAKRAFVRFFCPDPRSSLVWWHTSTKRGEEFSRQNGMDARIFALLLMAEMIRDERKGTNNSTRSPNTGFSSKRHEQPQV